MYFVTSSYWEASSCSASKKFPLHLWDPKFPLCLAYGFDIECCGFETSLYGRLYFVCMKFMANHCAITNRYSKIIVKF